MTRTMISLAVGLSSLIVSSAAAQDTSSMGDITPCVVLTGADCHVSERSYYRVTSMNEWAAIWQEHKGLKPRAEYDFYYNPAGLPVVDFERYMIVAIFQGDGWNSAGLEADSISEQEDRIVFRFDDKSYQTEGPHGGGKRVTVYGFFMVPRSTKTVVLEENVQRYKNHPPEWKERLVFPKL